MIWSAALALAVRERRKHPALRPAIDPGDPVAAVDVVIPARDEERAVGACVRSLLDQGPVIARVIVVDDGSRDRTAAAARAAGGDDPRLRVVRAEPLPDGWVGKNWAAWTGVGHTTAHWILFCDADVVHAPGAVASALRFARARHGGGVTLFPRVDAVTRAERWVIPAALVAIATFVAPGPLVRHPRIPVALAAGAFILVRRDAYMGVGGHAAIRDRMVDDVMLATRLKRAGRMLATADGTRLVHLRMYRGGGDLWRGWRKNASFATLGDPGAAVVGAGAVAVAGLAPWAALAIGVGARRPGMALRGAAGVAASPPCNAPPRRWSRRRDETRSRFPWA